VFADRSPANEGLSQIVHRPMAASEQTMRTLTSAKTQPLRAYTARKGANTPPPRAYTVLNGANIDKSNPFDPDLGGALLEAYTFITQADGAIPATGAMGKEVRLSYNCRHYNDVVDMLRRALKKAGKGDPAHLQQILPRAPGLQSGCEPVVPFLFSR
jgi:hypothetical protein